MLHINESNLDHFKEFNPFTDEGRGTEWGVGLASRTVVFLFFVFKEQIQFLLLRNSESHHGYSTEND